MDWNRDSSVLLVKKKASIYNNTAISNEYFIVNLFTYSILNLAVAEYM